MGLTRLEKWDRCLKAVFDEIDQELEAKYGDRYPLHPNRPPSGATANREDDGLFDLGASYTVGIGSQYGPGYVMKARMATLRKVPPEVQAKLETFVAQQLKAKLPIAFPNTNLHVDLDGHVYKIHGDLSLGRL